MNKTRSMRFRMFASFTLVLLIVILAFLGLDTARTVSTMKEEISSSMGQLAGSVAQRLDEEIRQLSLMTERIVFSAQLREAIINRLPGSEGAARYRYLTQLNDLMYSICGPNLTFYHVNIITDTGWQYAFGQDFGYTRLEGAPRDLDWYARAVALDGKKLVVPLSARPVAGEERPVVCVCRGFGLKFGLPVRAVVEMQRDYETIAQMVRRAAYPASGEHDGRRVYVLDREGALVYPLGLSQEELRHYDAMLTGGASQAKNPATGEDQLLFGAGTDYSGLRVVVAVPARVLLDGVRAVLVQTLAVSCLLIAAAAAVSFLLSRRFSIPIRRLCAYVDNLRLEQLGESAIWEIGSGVDELEALGRAFNQMSRRLDSSLDQAVEMKNAETHARMLALQAQMNPHFLYNTLAVINIMVEDGETEQVQRACKNLSNTLEYISTQELEPVTLQQELRHALNYMDLILMRYQDDIEFSLDMPEDILNARVPKLVLQPLVENAVKYATRKDPVWHVKLSGYQENGRWYARVQDDGDGFDLDTFRALREKIRLLRSGGRIPQLTLKGMGIMNIYMRLMMAYGEDMVFWIDNRPGEGASITIGGRLMPPDGGGQSLPPSA